MASRKRAAASRTTEEDGEAGGGSKDAVIATKARKTTVAKKSTARKSAAGRAASEGDKKEKQGTSFKETAASEEASTTAEKATAGTARKFSKVYQFKITLEGDNSDTPPIWRRIQVPEDYTFHEFQGAIQDAMGWATSHGRTRYEFYMDDGIVLAPRSLYQSMEDRLKDKRVYSDDAKISDYFHDEKMVATYDYRFGDSWQHDLLFEKVVQVDPKKVYPRCLGGRRACPPEERANWHGYEILLEAIEAPPECRDEEMEALVDHYSYYDPEDFDAKDVHFEDKRTGGL